MGTVQNLAAVVNTVVRPIVASPRWGRLVDRWMTVVTYTGRRSGRTFSIPVEIPDQKNWWRNFTGDGWPIRVRLGGVDRAGHGTARRGGRGVTVSVRLDPA